MIKTKTFAIIGGGIGGLATAVSLQRKGARVRVYESAPRFGQVGAGIVLAPNAVKAFESIGLAPEITASGFTLQNFSIRDHTGKLLTTTAPLQLPSTSHKTFSFHRAELHEILFCALKPDTVQPDKVCSGFSQGDAGIELKFKDGGIANADVVIAADGINSIFRKTLLPSSTLRYSGYTCWRGISHHSIGNAEAIEHWGHGKRFGIVPLSRDRTYWFATTNASPSDGSYLKLGLNDIQSMFSEFPSLVQDILSATIDERFIKNDIYDFRPIDRYAFGNILLLGDAAHATTPNLAQGACMAIEDAAVLTRCLEVSQDIAAAFKLFERKRMKRAQKIVNTSYSLGRFSQASNPFMASVRNVVMRMIPTWISEKQMRFLYDISFR